MAVAAVADRAAVEDQPPLVGERASAVAPAAALYVVSGGREADVTFSCVNVPDAELGAILATRDRGIVYFFAWLAAVAWISSPLVKLRSSCRLSASA